MLRIITSTSEGKAKSYYTGGLSQQDYYVNGQEIIGFWGGEAARRLGLQGQVTREAFMALCENLHPTTHEPLTVRTKAIRRVGYDFNFHVPKSVSVVQALTGDPRIVRAFRDSVNRTMREIERDAKP